jgi:hypothetical protein
VSLLHGRWRRRVSLLACGALPQAEREATLAHVSSCAACRGEQRDLDALLGLLSRDPLREAEPSLPLPALLTRVEARLDAAERRPARPAGRLLWPAAAALSAAALLAALWLVPRATSLSRPPAVAVAPEQAAAPDEMIDRLERSLARQQAARYLDEAHAVLVNVSSPPDCERAASRVDVEQEARQSRELLARRALLVELDGEPVRSARPVLEDVDTLLREVASLPACARSRDLAAIQREIERRRLLMKIDLMTRELAG